METDEYRLVNNLRIKAIVEDYYKNGDEDIVSKKIIRKSKYVK